jgi:voltage-gated potassium channel
MKFASSQLAYLLRNREARGNLRTLLKYLVTLALLITLYAVVFHVIKVQVEEEQHSWITGFYWTLVVMTTLGFGDITFTSDVGRLFSILVLLSGVVLLLVMLPSIDVLQLSGATTVLPLKHQLGEYLANRADTGGAGAM